MSIFWLIVIFTIVSGVLSMIGGVVLLWRRGWVKRFSVHFISFAAGALLGTSFLDLLPEAVHFGDGNGTERIFTGALLGILAMFFIERLVFNFHSHDYEEGENHRHATPILLLVGDGVHNFIDGVIVASAFLVDPNLGLVTAAAVAAHELPQEIADFSIMLHHNWSGLKVFWSNFFVSLTALVGAILTYYIRDILQPYLPIVLAISAGIFIYISVSDLFPEIDPKTSKDKTSHVLLLILAGIAAVWLAGHIEFAHLDIEEHALDILRIFIV